MKCFNKIVQSAVNAGREVDENPTSHVVTETTKPLANSSYAYQIMDWIRHGVKKNLSDEKTHVSIKNKMSKSLKSR